MGLSIVVERFFMFGLLFFVLIFSFLEIFEYFVLKERQGWQRILCCMFVISAILPCPFLAPENLSGVRFFLAMIVFNKIVKAVEITFHRVEPFFLLSFGRYLFWSVNFPKPAWPENQEEAAQIRKKGQKRILRCLFKATLLLMLFCFSTLFSFVDTCFYLRMFWLILAVYLMFSGIVDMVTGLIMQSGIFLEEVFDSPLIARSPREFWGKRWNLYFRNVSYRNIFQPLGGEKNPVFAAICVFIVSAILHEYMIFICSGKEHLGFMMCFFALHCLATIIQTTFYKKTGKKEIFPRYIAISLHLLWLLLTIPIFMEPMLFIFPAHTWKLW